MTSITANEAVVAKSGDFHFRMGLTCLAVAIIGFLPTFILPEFTGTFRMAPVFMLHGVVFFAWPIFFCTQAWLVKRGRMAILRSATIASIFALACVEK